jgi:hypothetical protein
MPCIASLVRRGAMQCCVWLPSRRQVSLSAYQVSWSTCQFGASVSYGIQCWLQTRHACLQRASAKRRQRRARAAAAATATVMEPGSPVSPLDADLGGMSSSESDDDGCGSEGVRSSDESTASSGGEEAWSYEGLRSCVRRGKAAGRRGKGTTYRKPLIALAIVHALQTLARR